MKLSEAADIIAHVVQYNLEQAFSGRHHNNFIVPFLRGDPGIGKTAAPRQVAQRLTSDDMEIVYDQVIVAQYDAGELAGLPMKSADGLSMIRLRPSYLPPAPPTPEQVKKFAKGEKDHGVTVGIFNLDELPQAFLANQNICSQMVNEWRVGEHMISPFWTICATGNKAENKAGTTTMPTHLRDRLMFLDVECDAEDWLDNFAARKGIAAAIRAYIRQNPAHLSKFNPAADACPSPRSWEKSSGILSMGMSKSLRTYSLTGQIGEGETVNFEAWLRVEDKLPKIEDIIKDPMHAPVFGNKDADVLYLLLTSLADVATEKNVGAILEYIKRLPNQEFCAFWASDAIKRDPKLNEVKAVTDWKMKHAAKLIF